MRRFLSVLAILGVMLLAVTTYTAARPLASPADSVAHVDSLPALSFHVGVTSDSVLSVGAVLASHPLPAHDAAIDSVAEHTFLPVTFNARPRRVRVLRRDSSERRDSVYHSGAG